jgi:hypothetical protein
VLFAGGLGAWRHAPGNGHLLGLGLHESRRHRAQLLRVRREQNPVGEEVQEAGAAGGEGGEGVLHTGREDLLVPAPSDANPVSEVGEDLVLRQALHVVLDRDALAKLRQARRGELTEELGVR